MASLAYPLCVVRPQYRSPPPRASVTTRAKPRRFGEAPDLTAEEHKQRGDAAEALFAELVRRATS